MLATQHVQIATLQPAEAGAVLDAVFASLSPESRRLRFHTGMARLPASVRDLLSSVDGDRHVAMAAWAGERPVGLGRMVGLGAGEAEIAVEVVDDFQGRGIGSDLLRALGDQAALLGYRYLVAEVLPDNLAMLRLLTGLFPGARQCLEDGTVRVRWPVVDRSVVAVVPIARRAELAPPIAC